MPSPSQSYIALVQKICQSIVDEEDFKLVSTGSADTTIIEIFARRGDPVAQLIGKNGQLIDAIRIIMQGATHRKHRVVVDVVEMP